MPHPKSWPERLTRAHELLTTTHYAALATVNEDGSPHNSPVFIAFDEGLRAYWASDPRALHSQNISRTGQVFIVLFDPVGKGGGLYIQAQAHQVPDSELPAATEVFNAARQRLLRETVPMSYFTGTSPQRLYCAVPQTVWLNMSEKDAHGHVVRDKRYEVTIPELRELSNGRSG